MPLTVPHPPRSALTATLRRQAAFVAARLNPDLNAMLAFWALYHCRHARPPAPRHRFIATH